MVVKRLDELEARVRPALAAMDADAAREYPGMVDRVRQAVRRRADSIAEQLAKAEA